MQRCDCVRLVVLEVAVVAAAAVAGAMATQHGGVSVSAPWPSLTPVGGVVAVGSGTATTQVAAAVRAVGWYRLRCYIYVAAGYDGSATPLTAQIGSGAALSSSGAGAQAPHPVALRAPRNEWLHYDEWVPTNVGGAFGVVLVLAPGGGGAPAWTSGQVQVAAVSVEFVAASARPLVEVELAKGGASVGCTGGSGAGECPPGYGNSALASAWDGDTGTSWDVSPSTATTIALELALGSPTRVCKVQVVFDFRCCHAGQWQLLALEAGGSDAAGWSTWAAAAPTAAAAAAAHPTARVALDSGGGVRSFGLGPCRTATRVRLQMARVEGVLLSLKELRLFDSTQTCTSGERACRNGGVCLPDGSCVCPSQAHSGCVAVACGYGGRTCATPLCVPQAQRDCAQPPFSRRCRGPNTCVCSPGYHTLAAAAAALQSDGRQCRATACGDGAVTASSGEQCDDGNLAAGDGCDQACQLEPLPPGTQRVLSYTPRTVWWGITSKGLPTVDELAVELGVPAEQICCVAAAADGESVSYQLAEYVVRCDRSCQNGGVCELRGGEHRSPRPVCQLGETF